MFNKYIVEIKNRFILILLSWIFTFTISYHYKEIIFFLILKPGLNIFNKMKITFVFTNLTEIFTSYINLSFFVSNQIFFIIFFYNLILFLSLALFKHEYKKVKYFYFLFLINFFFSIFLTNFVVLPYSWEFFLSYQSNYVYNLSFEPKVNEYLVLYKNIYYVVFYNNLFVCFFIYIVNYFVIPIYFRKYFYMFFFFNATLITPPDIISQIFVGLVQILLYEILIFSQFFKYKLIR